jgi:hypothetical protein
MPSNIRDIPSGEWYEYMPATGTDIAVTSNLASIA